MKTITINVTCSYDVEITTDVPDDVYDQLCNIYDNGGSISDSDMDNSKAMDWLADNINESDALNWEYKLNDFNEDPDE